MPRRGFCGRGRRPLRMYLENGEYKLKVYDGANWQEINRSVNGTITSEITAGIALNLDGGHTLFTVHDGNGNFNIKSGVDENHLVTQGAGGALIRLDHAGRVKLAVTTKNEGFFLPVPFSPQIELLQRLLSLTMLRWSPQTGI